MQEALKQAGLALKYDEVPVGAIIVDNKKIIACAYNQSRLLCDSTAHAEILAIRMACTQKNSARLDGCDIYTTLEPCAMCAGAISWARVRRIYYGVNDEKFGALESGFGMLKSSFFYHKPEIYSGICESQSRELLQNFFKKKR